MDFSLRAQHTILEWLPLPPRRRFQPFGHTGPDRYPWLFAFARKVLRPDARILSFGCSTGEELLSLHRYLPEARIKGIEIDPRRIAVARRRTAAIPEIALARAASTANEGDASCDALFCLAVLCDGRLTAQACERATPLLSFARFEAAVEDFARCLKPGGYLFLLTTNFRFRDTRAAAGFDAVLEAEESRLAPDLIYDRDNRLIPGERYREVVFRKRGGDAA